MTKRIRTRPVPNAKRRYRITNWRDYNRALIARGSITLWIHEEVLAGWRATGGKGRRYSDAAILAALGLRAVFRLTLRQTQGFLLDLTRLLGLTIEVPHYSTFCRRAAALAVPKVVRPAGSGPLHFAVDATGLKVLGEGEWKVRMHGKAKRRVWRSPPQGSLGHLERLIEPVEVPEWTVTRLEERRARRLQVSERPRLRGGRCA